jgi:hypothetical protein
MRAVIFGLVGAVLACGGAQAKETTYRFKEPYRSITVTMDGFGKLDASFEVVGRMGCFGGVSGTLTKTSETDIVLSADPVHGKQCRVKIQKQGTGIVFQEEDSESCSSFHGSACTFDTRVLTIR